MSASLAPMGLDQFRRLYRSLSKKAQANPSTGFILTFFFFLAAALLVGRSSLNNPFFWDDLHLIRTHTQAELLQVWSGTWDTDHIETPGFRPLTVYFNQIRALAFGESVVAHRLFLLVLFALFLSLAGMLARWLFSTSYRQTLLGGLLAFLHIYSVYHYAWISDGIHLFSGILIVAAILCLIQAMRSGKWGWLAGSFLCSVLAILTREDALTVIPLLFLFGAGFVWVCQPDSTQVALRKLPMALFAGALLVAVGVYWFWRKVSVPDALPLKPDPWAFLWGVKQVVQNVGDTQMLLNAWPQYAFLIWVWDIWLGSLLVIAVILLGRQLKAQVIFWACAALIATSPLLVMARANLLLLPVTFWGFLAATVLADFWRRSTTATLRAFALGMIIFALAASAYGSIVFESEQRENNLTWVCATTESIYGSVAAIGPTIPEARRVQVTQQLNQLRIFSLSDYNTQWPMLIERAMHRGRFGLSPGDLPFIPRFDFIPEYPSQWHCAAEMK